MNRQSLAEATSLHDGPVPVYLMEEIANATKASARDAEKIADYMMGRLNKSNLTVKLKALQIISVSSCFRPLLGVSHHKEATHRRMTMRAVATTKAASPNDSSRMWAGHNPAGGYNGPPPGAGGGYGGNSYGPSGGNPGGYGYNPNGSQGSQGGYPSNPPPPPQQQASGFDSWASSSNGGGLPAKSSSAGIWSSAGYQKKDPSMSTEPRYNPATRRDNRPTVLVGHSLNFPKPSGGFGNSNSASSSGLGGFNSGTYNPNAIAGASGANNYNPNAMGSSGMGSSGRSSWGPQQSGGAPSFMNNSNRMMGGSSHRIGSMGLPVNGQPLNDVATSTLGKRAEVLKKMGTAALEKWDRRNMDKSMASSLADHDELRAGPHVLDRGYYQPNAQQGTGGGDTSRDYERGMIDNLCASVGLSRAPPADGLKRFVDLAQTLDAQTIGDILLDKLEDPTWQVRLKGLHVVLALLDSPGAAPYQEFFEENVEVVEELRKDAKPSVVSKALQVLRALGFADEAEEAPPQPSARRSGAVRSERGSPTRSAPARGQQQEVDLLGFGALSLDSSAGPGAHGSANLLGSPPGAPLAPPQQTLPQEVSVRAECLLDGFDTLESSPNPAYAPQQQQQYYQQQPPQDERATALSHFGKDLFTIANSPRNSASTPGSQGAPAGQSAFNFM
ncbi:hypothetical protein BBJ28_00013453 [Nothophytophthora sp. Chile5]|nr:hypothetical protein BBJ28_00013453 [Nothophytophthora sp. Chile5]